MKGAVGVVEPEEAHDEVVDGIGQQLRPAAPLGDAGAVAQEDDLVAQRQGLVDVVGDEQDRLGELGLNADEAWPPESWWG